MSEEMNEEEFEKAHPGLAIRMKKWIAVFCKECDSYKVKKDIHETQRDKIVIEKAIDNALGFTKRFNKKSKNKECEMRLKDLKKELKI